jgi:(2Fe-2S) ferredoxin
MTFHVLLLARTGASAAPIRQMERLRDEAASMPDVVSASHAFIEEGVPSFRDALHALADIDGSPILIVPILLPAEPNFETWVRRTLQRWQAIDARMWPEIRVAPFLGDQPLMKDLLATVIASDKARTVQVAAAPAAEGSIVPAQKRRVLVCMGGPCHAAGATVVWGHLRNEQKRLSLRTTGDGTMSAKTSCLGPCGLAPVMQVWPEGTLYGGVDEAGVDRIIEDHLLGSRVVEALAYRPTGVKQTLRR